MSEIFFLCEHCEQSLDAPEDMSGEKISCPACGTKIEIPSESTIPAPPSDEIEEQQGNVPTKEEAEEEKKKATVKMYIPKDGAVYRPPRKVTIKRTDNEHDKPAQKTQKNSFAPREKKKGLLGKIFGG